MSETPMTLEKVQRDRYICLMDSSTSPITISRERYAEFLDLAEKALKQPRHGKWRVGGKVPLNVYEDDRPMFQCHTPEEAARVVGLLNGATE